MQPRSALFDQTVAGPHTVLVSADILRAGKVVASALPVVSGSVTGDRSQFARRTCTVVIGDPAFAPAGAVGDLLAPFGNEIRLYRGAVTPAGPQLVCVGTFGIRSAEFDHGPGFRGVTVTGIDRCKRLAEARFTAPRSSTYGGGVIPQIAALIREVIPYADVTIDPRVRDVTIPQITWPENRDQALTDMVTALGAEVFCDPLGGFVVQPVPSPTDPPTFTVSGGRGGVLVSARRSMTRDGVHNGVIARGQSTGTDQQAPTSDLIVDNDPTSITYWYGPFGQIVGFYDSSLIVDRTQANTVAAALLVNNVGLPASLNFGMAPNPTLAPGDVVAVVNPDTGQAERHIIDQLTMPLDVGGVATAQTRSTTTTLAKIQPAPAGALS